MFGVPVRVHPSFWLVSAILGWGWLRQGMEYLLLWVACVFVSILIHELGHVFMGRLFGADGHIILFAFGGLAVGSSLLANRWKRIAVYLAGPFAQFGLLGIVWLILRSLNLEEASRFLRATLMFLFIINLFWPLLNLLPIYPLDGGQISRDFLDWLLPTNGVRVSLGISFVLAGLLAIQALAVHFKHPLPLLSEIPYLDSIGGIYNALFFGSFAVNSFLALQAESQRPWEKDDDNWR
jgi:Zn-dependent protease